MRWLFLKSLWYEWFGKNYVAKACGHKAKLFFRVEIFGEKFFYSRQGKGPDYCMKCLAAMAIRCASCGKSIITEDFITLHGKAEGEEVPEHAVSCGDFLVCCTRSSCAMLFCDAVGKWVAPGKVWIPDTPEAWLEMIGGRVVY